MKKKKLDDWWNTPFNKWEYDEYYKFKRKVRTTDKQIQEDFWQGIEESIENYNETIEDNQDFFDK